MDLGGTMPFTPMTWMPCAAHGQGLERIVWSWSSAFESGMGSTGGTWYVLFVRYLFSIYCVFVLVLFEY